MTEKQPTYRELEIEIQEAKDQILSLYRHEADAIVGEKDVFVIRTRQIEEKIRQARRKLEQQLTEKTGEMDKLKQDLRALLDENECMVRELDAGRQALRERAEDLHRLSRQLGTAEERERRRLAAILHDDIQQLMVGAKFHLEIANRFVSPEGRESYQAARDILAEAIDKTRHLSHDLNPPVLRQRGLLAALRWLAENMAALHHLQVDCDIRAGREPDDEQVRTFLFRAVNELFFNIVKHAGVDRAGMEVCEVDQLIAVIVTDRGRGFDVEETFKHEQAGLGLFDIRQRARTLGGQLLIESAPGKGSRFTLCLPLTYT